MQSNFSACLAVTEQFEGGYVDDPLDPGGETYKGVTQRIYLAWPGHQHRFVANATDAEIAAVYREQYWNAVRGDDLFAGLDMVLFDIAVNSGPIVAIKFLQEALRVAVDGQFGIQTMAALCAVNDRAGLIKTICQRRVSFWHACSRFWRFGRGWLARGAGVETKALAMLEANP